MIGIIDLIHSCGKCNARNKIVLGILILTGFSVLTSWQPIFAKSAQSDNRTGESQWQKYFPLKVGTKRLYIAYDVNPQNPDRTALHATSLWEEVKEEKNIHGFRVIVARTSEGTLEKQEGQWIYGRPDGIEHEDIYVITPNGIDWLHSYEDASGKDLEYRKIRHKLLDSYENMSKAKFVKTMDNYILPFPAKPGTKVKYGSNEGYYEVLRPGNDPLSDLDRKIENQAIGVAGDTMGQWQITRWFLPGKGVIMQEQQNGNPDDNKDFPITVLKLIGVYSKIP